MICEFYFYDDVCNVDMDTNQHVLSCARLTNRRWKCAWPESDEIAPAKVSPESGQLNIFAQEKVKSSGNTNHQ